MSSSSNCCQTGCPAKDAKLNAVQIKDGNFCRIRSTCSVIQNMKADNVVTQTLRADNVITNSINIPSYLYIGQSGTQGGPVSFNPGLFVSDGQGNPVDGDLNQAFWFILPLAVKSCRINLSMFDGLGVPDTVDNLNFFMADPATGNPFSGLSIPAVIGDQITTNINGTIATHILDSPLAPETPFVIFIQQSGGSLAIAEYRFKFSVEI